MIGRFAPLLIAGIALLPACGSSPTSSSQGSAWFVVEVIDERFVIRLQDPALVAQARRILNGEEPQKIVTGDLAAGDDGYNGPWSWHLTPRSTQFVEAAIELCDGKPSFVEGALDYWLGTVGRYCPWSGRIVAETDVLQLGAARTNWGGAAASD